MAGFSNLIGKVDDPISQDVLDEIDTLAALAMINPMLDGTVKRLNAVRKKNKQPLLDVSLTIKVKRKEKK